MRDDTRVRVFGRASRHYSKQLALFPLLAAEAFADARISTRFLRSRRARCRSNVTCQSNFSASPPLHAIPRRNACLAHARYHDISRVSSVRATLHLRPLRLIRRRAYQLTEYHFSHFYLPQHYRPAPKPAPRRAARGINKARREPGRRPLNSIFARSRLSSLIIHGFLARRADDNFIAFQPSIDRW